MIFVSWLFLVLCELFQGKDNKMLLKTKPKNRFTVNNRIALRNILLVLLFTLCKEPILLYILSVSERSP